MIIDLATMYNAHSTLFDGLSLPVSPNTDPNSEEYVVAADMDKDYLIARLLARTMELEVYPANPEVLQIAIKAWSDVNQVIWQKQYDLFYLKYVPMYNNFKHSTTTDDWTPKVVYTPTGTDKTEVSEAAFNSAAPVDVNKTEYTPGVYMTPNGKTDNRTINVDEYGNIGVMTTADIIEKEMRLWKSNMYDQIIDSFMKEFCLLIY